MVQDASIAVPTEYCRHLYSNYSSNVISSAVRLCCELSFDGISTWPPTPNYSYAVIKCPAKAYNKSYNYNENATRYCSSNGTWTVLANYNRCLIVPKVYDVLVIWFIGYTISLISSCVALILLRYFRSLRCLRNEIHCNLIVSYIIRVLIWYFNVLPQTVTFNWPVVVANIGRTLFLFSRAANFFWMLVEGLYLFTVIVWTYGIEKYNIWHYSIIGWGIPFILTAIETLTIGFSWGYTTSWITQNQHIERIQLIVIHIPIFVSIITNVFFMAFIIYTLVTKLKQTKQPFRRNSSKFSIFSLEYKKAIKAAVVLIPLLGFAHCLVMFKPEVRKHQEIYKIFSSSITSLQGFFVAIIYCFLNREVRFVLGARYRSFRGLLPNNRLRHTVDDSITSTRRSNSIYKLTNQNDVNNISQCRSKRILNSISDSTIENASMNKSFNPLVVYPE